MKAAHCDRCGKVAELALANLPMKWFRLELPSDVSPYASERDRKKDLCDECMGQLWEWAKPVSKKP